jgi:hypothetical protein
VVARILKKRKIADISFMTVQRAAHARGLRPFKRPKTSRLSPKQQKDRLAFAKSVIRKDWSAVVFSDEHTFRKHKAGNPRHEQIWAKSASEVPPKEVERWGLTLNVWAGISSQGKTGLHFYEGTLDAAGYQGVLQQTLLPAANEMFQGEWELQQDKATAHTAASTRAFLQQQDIAVVDGWPTKGDDISPIENLWAILDDRLEDKKYTTKAGMKRSVSQIWNEVDQSLLDKLVESVPDRLRRVVKAKGGSIKRVK